MRHQEVAVSVDYRRPPIAESVIGIEFDPIPGLGIIALAELHKRWSDDFPIPHEVDALPPSRPAAQGPGVGIFLGEGPGSRLWSISADQHLLVQVQRDRILLNWRRLDGERGTYPGFDQLRAQFERVLNVLEEFVTVSLRSTIRPLVSEWSYINHIVAEGELGKEVFHVWRDPQPGLAGEVLQSRFQHVRAWGEPDANGQLEITGEPMGSGPLAPLQVAISCKYFAARSTTVDNALKRCEEAHAYARNAFEVITTDEARKVWEGLDE